MSEARISQYWEVIDKETGDRNAVQLDCDTDRAMKLHELFTSNGMTVKPISCGDYLQLCEEIDRDKSPVIKTDWTAP